MNIKNCFLIVVIVLKVIIIKSGIEKRELFTSLTFLRYRQTPNSLQRVMLTPSGANHLLTLVSSFKFGDFQEQDSADASTYIPFPCLCYVTIRNSFLGVTHYAIESKNRLNYFIYYFIKVLLFDGTETTIDITLNVARDNVTFHKAGL